jgi:hypothetical protein
VRVYGEAARVKLAGGEITEGEKNARVIRGREGGGGGKEEDTVNKLKYSSIITPNDAFTRNEALNEARTNSFSFD